MNDIIEDVINAKDEPRTEDALNVSLAHPGTNFLASEDEINDMPKNAIFPTANYPYDKKMGKAVYEKEKNCCKLNWLNFNVGLKIVDKNI